MKMFSIRHLILAGAFVLLGFSDRAAAGIVFSGDLSVPVSFDTHNSDNFVEIDFGGFAHSESTVRFYGDAPNLFLLDFKEIVAEAIGDSRLLMEASDLTGARDLVRNLPPHFEVANDSGWGAEPKAASLHGRHKALIGDGTILRGEFQDNVTGYLGVRFKGTNDLTHYGWISYQATNTLTGNLTGVITGWAYENQAGASIAVSAVPEPTSGTLVLLLCLSSLAIRRRRSSWVS